jgi:hypothetical protein
MARAGTLADVAAVLADVDAAYATAHAALSAEFQRSAASV